MRVNKIFYLLIVLSCIIGCHKSDSPTGPTAKTETLVYYTNFSSVPSGWMNNQKSSDGKCSYVISDSLYSVIDSNHAHWYSANIPYGYGSFYGQINGPYAIQADMTTIISGTTDGACGFEFNRQDTLNKCLFYLDPFGSDYEIRRLQAGNYAANPVSWTFSNKIKPSGQLNTVKLIQHAQSLDVVINGSVVGSYSIGLPTGNLTTGVLSISFDNTTNPIAVTSLFTNVYLFSEGQ